MKFRDFLNKKNILEKLLSVLKVYREEKLFYDVSISPDYFNDRQREERLHHTEIIDFSYLFDDIVCVDLDYVYGLDSSIIMELKKEYNISDTKFEHIVNAARDDHRYQFDKDEIYLSGFEVENFKARLIYDNQVEFSCNFNSSVSIVDNPDSHFFLDLKLYGLNSSFEDLPIYKQALCESYKLMHEGKIKLSFFMAYVAFDSVVNYFHKSALEEKRLSEKFNELFLEHSPDKVLQNHQIYTMICSQINEFEMIRNGIAHGDSRGQCISDEQCQTMLVYVSMAICSLELGIHKLVDLNNEIKKI